MDKFYAKDHIHKNEHLPEQQYGPVGANHGQQSMSMASLKGVGVAAGPKYKNTLIAQKQPQKKGPASSNQIIKQKL